MIYVALIVNVSCAEYVPVAKLTSLLSVKSIETEFGSDPLHDPPPPVQALAGIVKTEVCDAVLTVCVPEHPVPSVAPEHVYFSVLDPTDGPPDGEKSEVACTVIAPLPAGVVLTRKLTGKDPVNETKVVLASVSERLAGTDTLPIGESFAVSVWVAVAVTAKAGIATSKMPAATSCPTNRTLIVLFLSH